MHRTFVSGRIALGVPGAVAALVLSAGSAAAATTPKVPAAKRPAAAQPPKGDVAAGRQVYAARCAACHGADAAGGAIGPSLAKAYGAKAASAAFPRYSNALKASGLTWTQANLDAFLGGPGRLVPGSTMIISVPNPTDRANLVAFLASLAQPGAARTSR